MQHHQHKKLSVMGRLELAERFFAGVDGGGAARGSSGGVQPD